MKRSGTPRSLMVFTTNEKAGSLYDPAFFMSLIFCLPILSEALLSEGRVPLFRYHPFRGLRFLYSATISLIISLISSAFGLLK